MEAKTDKPFDIELYDKWEEHLKEKAVWAFPMHGEQLTLLKKYYTGNASLG
jgi:hypothetical protein